MRLPALLSCLVLAGAAGAAELPAWLATLQPADEGWRKTEQVFRFNNTTEVETLDPHLMTGVPEHRIALALFEGLVTLHPATLAPLPGIAERWERSEDGLAWTFHLAPDARWSDGTAVTAADIVASWKRVLTPATAAEYAYQLYPVAGAEAYHRGEVADFDRVGIAAVDPRTLRVRLGWPCPYFLDLAAFPTLAPVPTALVAAQGEQWTRPGTLVGNGPFVLKEWKPRQVIVLEPNPHYRFRAAVKLCRIEIYPFESQETALLKFGEGQLDWQPAVPVSRVQDLKLDPDYYATPYLGTYFYRFNCTREPFDDPGVRRALSLAIDRRQITDDILKAGQQPTGTFCPPGCNGYVPVALPGDAGYDLDAARAAWAATPYGRGERPWPETELLFNTSESHRVVAENVVQQWRQKLGVEVRLRNAEWQVYLDLMNRQDYQVMRSAWIGDYNDPMTFFDLFVSGGGNNRTGFADPRYDELLRRTTTEGDHAARLELFQQLERILVTEGCPVAPVYFYVNQGMLAERVRGWHPNLRDQHPYQHLWLED